MNNIKGILILLLLALLLVGPVLAQVSPNYELNQLVLSGGGGWRESANFEIADVLGQWADGQSRSENFQVDPGFWGVGGASEEISLFMPVVVR